MADDEPEAVSTAPTVPGAQSDQVQPPRLATAAAKESNQPGQCGQEEEEGGVMWGPEGGLVISSASHDGDGDRFAARFVSLLPVRLRQGWCVIDPGYLWPPADHPALVRHWATVWREFEANGYVYLTPSWFFDDVSCCPDAAQQ